MKKETPIEQPEQKTLSVTELKATAYDIRVEMERLTAIYNNIQAEIARQINNDKPA